MLEGCCLRNLLCRVISVSYTQLDCIRDREGIPVVLVSIPLRYMHHPAEVADEKDVEDCIALIAEFLVRYQELSLIHI